MCISRFAICLRLTERNFISPQSVSAYTCQHNSYLNGQQSAGPPGARGLAAQPGALHGLAGVPCAGWLRRAARGGRRLPGQAQGSGHHAPRGVQRLQMHLFLRKQDTMADRNSSPAATTSEPAAPGHLGLKQNAIGLGDAIIVGMASSGPTASLAVTLAAIVAACSYAGPVAIAVCFLPMLGIALAYRRLNQWRVDCGASYVWVGRAITPYLGFIVGWIMLLGYFLGTISDILPVGPYVLQIVAPGQVNSSLAAAISASVWLVIVTVIAYIGIQLTARFQWLLASIEYLIITVFAVVTLVAVLRHHRGTSAFHWSWLSWHSLGGTSGLVSGILIAVYMFSGWDTSVYVNEETQRSRVNPGRAVVVGV